MKFSSWVCLGFLAMVQPLWANGGGFFRGGVERAGDVAGFEPQETEKIRILDEKLTVALGKESAEVEVRYLMRNETDKKVKVRFGFPVEESNDEEFMVEPNPNPAPKKGDLKYCRNYVITAAGMAISSKWQMEENRTKDQRMKGIAGWLISEITFAAGEEKPVLIRFKSLYPNEEWDVSDNTTQSESLFRYRLSTAACWAGTIGTGRIILKPDGIDPKELKVLKPVNRFKKEGENWVWNFDNLEPTLADDLEIEARPYVHGHNNDDKSRYIERGGEWSMSHTNYEVKASSTLAPADGETYDAEQVKNLYGQTTWTEGAAGPGIGEWLELKPVAAKPLLAIEIQPGYLKTDELFQANARPKKMLIELNGEHSFTVEFPDSKEPIRFPVQGYSKAVKKIRLTFQEVWPGKRFEDLCVSGIRLHVKLDAKPKIQPSR